MKKVNVEDAVGMTLCHDMTAMFDGFKGPLFKRGHVIEEGDIQKMLDIGKKTVFVWEENAGEIHEEDAALRMAAMCPCAGAHYEGPSEGKMLLIADQPGMLRIERDLLYAVDAIEDLTIATLPDHYPIQKGDRLASMRIVPLVTKEKNIEEAEKICAGKQMIRLLPYKPLKAGVVITGSEVYSGRIKDKFEPVARKKLEPYPGEIVGVTICDDNLDMIVDAAKEHLKNGADFLIFSGGMSVDPDDLTPSAIRKLAADMAAKDADGVQAKEISDADGADSISGHREAADEPAILTHGVPSQPGNMTLIAYIGDIPVLGVPGAAISMPTTVFDVVLPQIYTGEKFTMKDVINLSDGGVCQLCKPCHYPNCTFGRY